MLSTCDYGDTGKVSGEIKECYYDNGMVIISVDFSCVLENCKAIFAIYNQQGKMIAFNYRNISTNDIAITNYFMADENYEGYKVKIFFWDNFSNLKSVGNVITGEISNEQGNKVIESSHPYASNTDEIYSYFYNGECESISITFSNSTEVEYRFDYVYIYDINDNLVGTYTGLELAGRKVTIEGKGFKIRLVSDEAVNTYGYKIEKIEINLN